MAPVAIPSADPSGLQPSRELTLSALTGLLPEDARTATAIERQLDAIRGAATEAERDRLTDELLAEVFPPITTERELGLTGIVAETELRLLWGDR